MLKKTPVKKTNKTSVVFAIDGYPEAQNVALAAEFNDWTPTKTPLKRRKDGSWSVTVRLPRDAAFEYKFVVDEKTWIADESDGGEGMPASALTPEQQLFSGRTLGQPSIFIAGACDWGVYQRPGTLERMESGSCTDLRGIYLVEGAGHWVQQEQAELTAGLLAEFLQP